MKALLPLVLFCLLVPVVKTYALTVSPDTIRVEQPDSVREKEHSPTRATILSACVPGLGQIYNRKYWKVPVVYAGFGVLTYFIYTNADYYISFKCAYIESSLGNKYGSYANLVQRYTADQLLSAREYYRRNLEVSIIFTTLWYVLNILDATVDAHLYTYNISDKLSMKLEPALLPAGTGFSPSGGLRVCLNF
ncbi:MAG TPA: DUF5683 domain-containing protein [Bacteroidales bacterium]|nr:DUF5683 domain-containing protein [Bacteroidales bacterium]